MRVHITQTTKQFLPDKKYKIVERGLLEVSGKNTLNTYLVVGKYNKSGNLENVPYMDVQEAGEKIEKKHNPKWEGFKLL
jgi:hypothetical protein